MLVKKTTFNKEDRLQELMLFTVAVFLLFWALGDRSLWAAEGRWAEITRNMLLTKDFFHPVIGDEPYFDKPLLSYWLIGIIAKISGTLNELVVRIPSAFAGILSIWATVRIGTRLWSAQVGRIAGWMLLTTYAFLFWSRTGTTETENMAAIILAVAWYWARRNKLNFVTFVVFYLITFVGALSKGLTSVVVPVLVVMPDIIQKKRWRDILRPAHFLALVLAFGIYLTPFITASITRPQNYQSSGLALVFQENIQRFFEPFDHKGPFYLYFYELPILLLPWAPLFIAAIVGIIKNWKELDSNTRWLIKAIIIIFLFFSLSGSRRGYYILPIVPFCALLMAVFIVWMNKPQVQMIRRFGMEAQKTIFFGLIILELNMPFLLIIAKRITGIAVPLSLSIASLTIGFIALVLGFAAFKSEDWFKIHIKTDQLAVSFIAIAIAVFGGYFGWQQNILEINRTERPFARSMKIQSANLPPNRIAIFHKANANMLFYLSKEKSIKILKNYDELHSFVESNPSGAVISQTRYITNLPSETLTNLQKCRIFKEKVLSWESESSKKEKWVAWLWGQMPDNKIDLAAEEKLLDAR
jgi:4-amino-4-deoxy-L-arabinose transferase-like glycosyltransferase